MESYDELEDLSNAWQGKNAFVFAQSSNGDIESPRNIDEDKYSLDAFKKKLDDLTGSLENNVAFEELISEAKKKPQARKPLSPFTDHDPRLDVTPTIRRSNATGGAARSNVPPSVGRIKATPEPPTPVKTPLRDAFIESPDGFAARINRISEVADPKTTASDADRREVKTLRALVESLHDALERQEERVRRLEHENEIVRSKLQQIESRSPASSSYRTTAFDRNSSESRHRSTPNRCSGLNDLVSPGTEFVATLAQMLDLPEDQYATLSHIMDRHLDRILESRGRSRRDEDRR